MNLKLYFVIHFFCIMTVKYPLPIYPVIRVESFNLGYYCARNSYCLRATWDTQSACHLFYFVEIRNYHRLLTFIDFSFLTYCLITQTYRHSWEQQEALSSMNHDRFENLRLIVIECHFNFPIANIKQPFCLPTLR
jgi:hypothetical protein